MIFITFEGGEGSGKSLQSRLLAERLNATGIPALHTREPGGCPQAETLRSLLVSGETDQWTPKSEILLFTAARLEHLKRTIHPALDEGMAVVCDRFIDSTLAYQGAAHGTPRELILGAHETFCDGFMPDLTFILDIDPEIGLARAGKRNTSTASGEDRFESHGLVFHRKVREGFFETARDSGRQVEVLDATQSIEALGNTIFDKVHEVIARKQSAPRLHLEEEAHARYFLVKNGDDVVGQICRCMDGESWSVSVAGVKWKLDPNDHRRLVHPDGLMNVTYADGKERALELAEQAWTLLNESTTAPLILPMAA